MLRWNASANLLPRQPRETARWDAATRAQASVCAGSLQSWAFWRAPSPVLFVLCGRRAASSFGYEYLPLTFGNATHGDARARNPYCLALILPHPSGMNRWWNEPENVVAARNVCVDAMKYFDEPMGHETARSHRHGR